MGNDGWSQLFHTAFRQSRNAMVLLDDERRQVDMNGAYLRLVGHKREALIGEPIYRFVVGGPLVSVDDWQATIAAGQFTGEAGLVCADGSAVEVQWAGTAEVVTGRRLVLFVALSTSRWGRHFRRPDEPPAAAGALSPREREVVRLLAAGSSGPEVAEELGIAHETVRTHVRNAMRKLGARSRAQLVAKALGEGVVLG
jgi:PAS domain S-box-containing protein